MYQVWSNPLKDVDPRVFTRIVTDGRVTISPRNFVGEGIIKLIASVNTMTTTCISKSTNSCHFEMHKFSNEYQ
jgi:hypothetical protein